MNCKPLLIILFHLFGILHYAYAIFYDYMYVFPEEVKIRKYSFGGKFVYLTFWDTVSKFSPKGQSPIYFLLFQILQLFYFSVALVNDFIGSNAVLIKNRPLIRKIKDYIFTSLAFPLAFHVGVMFWGLFFYNRELVAPKVWDNIFPVWLNHFIHTDIMFLIFIEMNLVHRHYPIRIWFNLAGLLIIMVCYISWVHVINNETGHWIYPILGTLNWAERIGFHAFNVFIAISFYFLGQFLNNRIWNKERVTRSINFDREQKMGIELA